MRLSYRWMIVVAALLLASWGLAPSVLDAAADGKLDRDLVYTNDDGQEVTGVSGWLPEFIMNNGTPLTLGLDLQGGLLLQYEVLLEKAIQDKLRRMSRDVEGRITDLDQEVDVEVTHPPDTYRIEIDFQQAGKIGELIDTEFMANYTNLEKVVEGDGEVHLVMTDEYIDRTKKLVVNKAVETIRERVNSLGVTEPSVTRRGEGDIVVQLPGLGEDDRARAKELIGQTARLRFRLVSTREKSNDFFNRLRDDLPNKKFKIRRVGRRITVTHPSKEKLESFLEGRPEDGFTIGYKYVPKYKDKEKEVVNEEESYWRTYYIHADTRLTGSRVQNAQVRVGRQTNRPVVSLTFDRQGADKFAELTRNNVDRRFAIMLDDEVQSAPTIQEEIPGGRARITMGTLQSYSESQQQAQDLVIVLRHGALPAPIDLKYETAVGPTLGQESINSSLRALAVGSVLVILFVGVYYRKSGLISVLALLFNMVIVLSVLASLGATLTLPGIAGIILTVGMAVDANVIIFERIREEVRADSSPREAIQAGFDKALSAVMDANVTTGIAALVLMQYGTGPIRGFAVTLLIGIVGTIFTAVFVSRVIFDTVWTGEADDATFSI